MSQALTTVMAMGKAVQTVETLEDASKVHSGLAGVARMLGKSRKDPDTLIGATEWRIRLEHRIGGISRDIEGVQGERTDLTSSDGRKKSEVLENAGFKRDASYRYEVMNHCPIDNMEAHFTACRAKRKENVVRLPTSKEVYKLGLTTMNKDLDITQVGDDYRIIHSDLIDADIADNSVDCIITDPPYPKEFIGEYSKLSRFAAQVLKPGGSCLAMAGQSYLPDVVEALQTRLSYHWVLAYLTPGGQSPQIWPRKVNTFWKPVLWFVKDDYAGEWVGDVARSNVNDNDKRFHDWGQSESGMADLVERFTKPGDLILDPFVGGGATAIAALSRNRRFIGIDKDEAQVKITLGRIADFIVQEDADVA